MRLQVLMVVHTYYSVLLVSYSIIQANITDVSVKTVVLFFRVYNNVGC